MESHRKALNQVTQRNPALPWLGSLLALAGAGVSGWAAMNTIPEALVLLLLAPLFWAIAPNRWWAGSGVAVFVIAAGWTVVPAVPEYFGADASLALGIVALGLVGMANAVPWTLLWATQGRWWRVILALFLITLPPVGLVGWASPLNAAGLFAPPGSSWAGLMLTLVFLMLAVQRRWVARGLMPVIVLFLPLNLWLNAVPQIPPTGSALGIHSNLPQLEITAARAVVERQDVLLDAVRGVDARMWVLPEAIAGEWLFAEPLWARHMEIMKSKGQGGWVGAVQHESDTRYANVMVGVGVFAGEIYRQRFPIPWAMWRPWSSAGAAAHWDGGSVFATAQGTIGILLCYEQLIVAPILQTFWAKPDLILAPSNAWWARTPHIPKMQDATMKSWSRLFAVPAIVAVNSELAI